MAKVHLFDVGYCTHPGCMAVKGAGVASIKFPARAYLIETRSGLYLWDTGYSEHFHTCARGAYAPYKWITPVHYNHETEQLRSQLAKVGLQPADLKGLLLSHFHADHIAGLRDFPNIPLWCSPEALSSIKGLKGIRALLQAFIPGLLPDDFDSRIKTFGARQWQSLPVALKPFDFGWSVGGTDEIFVIPLPGHAAGHVGAFIQTSSGWLLLAADAAWSALGYTDLIGPSELAFLIQHDKKAYFETLAKLQVIHKNGIPIFLTHA